MSTITFGVGHTALGYTDGFTRDAERHLRLVAMPAIDEPRLRLTRRGRMVVVTLALLCVSAITVLVGAPGAATSDVAAPQQYVTITVHPGQTLWDIASRANPAGDVRETIDAILKLNGLDSASGLQAGAQLAVPRY